MIDFGFDKLALISAVALIVIGPEKLPRLARTLGHLAGKLQRYVSDVKADINREIELDELRKLKGEVQSAAQEIERSVTQVASEVEGGVRSVETELNATAAEATAPATPSTPTAPMAPASDHAVPPVTQSTADAPRQPSLPGFDRI